MTVTDWLSDAEAAYKAGKNKMICWDCGGGATEEISASVWVDDDGKLRTFCHRDSCGKSRGSEPYNKLESRGFRPKFFTEPTKTPGPESYWFKLWQERIEQRPDPSWFKQARFTVTDNDTAVWDCRDFFGNGVGVQTRTPSKVVRSLKEVEGPFYNAYIASGERKEVFLFEDPFSAGIGHAHHQLTAVALMGTRITRELAEHFRSYNQVTGRSNKFFLALDPGVERSTLTDAISILQAVGLDAFFVPLSRDFKNLRVVERQRWIKLLRGG